MVKANFDGTVNVKEAVSGIKVVARDSSGMVVDALLS